MVGVETMDTYLERIYQNADECGWQQLHFVLECVAHGDLAGLKKLYEDQYFIEKENELFQNNLNYVIRSFLYIWPQISRIAVNAGVDERTASEVYIKHFVRLFAAKSVPEVLLMNQQVCYEYTEAVVTAKNVMQYQPIVRKCRKYISNHIYENITIGYIAKALGYSESHLSRIYKKETGETIYQRVQKEKIAEAKYLLLNPLLSINDIQSKLGYYSQSHFTQHFRKEVGVTPNRYRNQFGCAPITPTDTAKGEK